ncbi:MAG: ATP-binding protein [Planctomyces sp.]
MRGLDKKCLSGFAQPIWRIPGEQDIPWDADSITQIQRTGVENPDFGSVFVRGRVARPFIRRVPLTSAIVRTSSVCRRFAAGRSPDDRNSGGCVLKVANRRPLPRKTTAQMNGTLELALKAYLKPSLLLLDELGYLPIDKRGADLLFQVVAARYESGSIVITTNRPFRDWGRIFDVDNTLATAMIDRLMHHGEAMVILGSSFRTQGETRDEESHPRLHVAQIELAASVRAVRHLPETLLALFAPASAGLMRLLKLQPDRRPNTHLCVSLRVFA